MNHYFVLCDEEKEYVERFTALLNERNLVPLGIQGITDVSLLESFCNENIVDILFVDEDLYEKYQWELPVKSMFLLTEISSNESETCLFKYQPVSALVEKALVVPIGEQEEAPEGKAKIISVYSPVRGNEKTIFSLALGQVLAKEQGVIYLNYSALTGVASLLGKEGNADLTDVLYLFAQGKKEPRHWKERCVGTISNLDYILPVVSPLDLRSAASEHWLELLEQLQKDGDYQTILVELDESCEAFLPVLQRSSIIYMPLKEDKVSMAQRRQLEEWLYHMGQSALVKRIVPVKPPFHNGFGNKGQFVEQLIWGELGDYVRSLLWGK